MVSVCGASWITAVAQRVYKIQGIPFRWWQLLMEFLMNFVKSFLKVVWRMAGLDEKRLLG